MIPNDYAMPMHIVKPALQKKADAFITGADDFLQYPINVENFLGNLERIPAYKTYAPRKTSHFFVRVNLRLVRIDLNDVFHVEALSDYVNIYTKEKRYTVHSTMKDMENKLPMGDFVRVHRSHIVRMDRISEIENDTLTIEKKIIPVSVSYKQQLKQRLNII